MDRLLPPQPVEDVLLLGARHKTDLPAALCDSTAQAGEAIPLAALKESITRAAYSYTGKRVGPTCPRTKCRREEEVGNLPAPRPATRQAGKGGSLPARAALQRSRRGTLTGPFSGRTPGSAKED